MPVRRGSRGKRERSQKLYSLVAKRTIVISGRRTGVSLEDAFSDAMHEIALAKRTTRMALITKIDKRREQRKHLNLSSAIRLFTLGYYQGLRGATRPRSK
jgi:predicted DNA-binding ribbon-helix-helix protein